MTAGTAEKVWRLLDKRVTPAAGAVLTYLAYRAHYEDGRCAWPSVETIAECCFVSVKTVQRSIALLIELGYVRENPNQQWNQLNPETGEWKRKGYRTVVYDVLTEHMTTVRTPREERARDRAAMSEVVAGPEDDGGVGQNVAPAGSLEIQGNHDADRMSPLMDGSGQNVRESGQNVALLTSDKQLPPTPTGCPPASGESPEREDGRSGEDTGRDSGVALAADAGGDARRVCAHLADARRAVGLTCPDATGRDLAAVARLLERVRAAGVADPVARVCSAVDWAIAAGGGYWRRRLRSGRRLADGWDELVDDMTLAQNRSATQPSQAAVPCTSGHREDCEHVRAVGEAAEFRERYPVFSARHAHDAHLAELADRGLSQADLRMVLRGLLREDAQAQRVRAEQAARDKARVQQELAEARARNGGSMFTAARTAGRGGAA